MWTNDEKSLLISLYPNHTDKELCDILRKTPGQIRGMKERLGLNSKFDVFTVAETNIIREYYNGHPSEIDLDYLSKMIGRPKTSIARWAGKNGLTKNNRPLTESAKSKSKESIAQYMQTDYYKNSVHPKQVSLLSIYAKNNHPKGMLGKHHTDDVKARMSVAHERLWRDMPDTERRRLTARMKAGKIASGTYKSTSSTYSRCHGGYRNDLGTYFRSSWEANIARILNHLMLDWEYESKRFNFPDIGDGVLSYCPDFYVTDAGIWIEVKGWMDDKSIKRLHKFQEYYPEEFAHLIVIDEPIYTDILKRFMAKVQNLERLRT